MWKILTSLISLIIASHINIYAFEFKNIKYEVYDEARKTVMTRHGTGTGTVSEPFADAGTSLDLTRIFNHKITLPKYVYNGQEEYTLVGIAPYSFFVWTYSFYDLVTLLLPESAKTICNSAFSKNGWIKGIVIPENTLIGDWAFEYCTSLEEIKLQNASAIGINAFYNCRALKEVILPYTLKSIYKNSFEGCTGLIKSAYPSSITNIFPKGEAIVYPYDDACIEDGIVYSADKTVVYYVSIYCEDFVFPPTVKEIKKGALYGCNGKYAYYKGTIIPDSECKNAMSYPVDDYVIEDGAVYSPDKSILYYVPKSGGFVIPPTVKEIADSAFWRCDIGSIVIPGTVRKIGKYAFSKCANLQRAEIYDGITEIPPFCFYDSERLKKITLPSTLKKISEYAFRNCTLNDGIILPENLETIESCAFGSCQFKQIDLPKQLKHIGGSAFNYCEKLEEINLQEGVEYIGKRAFRNTSISSFVMPASVNTIGDAIFDMCYELTSLYFKSPNPPSVEGLAYDWYSAKRNICTLYIPKGSYQNYYLFSIDDGKSFKSIVQIDYSGIDEIVCRDDEELVSIYDLSGQLVYTGQIKDAKTVLSGIYIVRLQNRSVKILF